MKKRKLIAALLIIHGLMHLMFEFIIYNPDTSEYVGWSGQSWLLTAPLGSLAVLIIGRILWGLIIAGFILSGIMLIFKLKVWRLLDIISSIVSLIAYLLFWNGLAPVPYYWVSGPIIAVVTLIALLIFRFPKDDSLFTKYEDNQLEN